MAPRCSQIAGTMLLLLLAGLPGGCAGSGSKSGWSLNGNGSSVDFDPHAKKLEVRPLELSLPVGKQVLLLATVYDDQNKPRSKKRVEWKIEGPGIVQVIDEGGFIQGRGFHEDSKSAVTFTHNAAHDLPPGIDNPLKQVIRPGQTWCVISSAAEGQTIVHAYAPEIADAQNNRVVAKVNWVDAAWQFPEASSARAGSELLLQTKVSRHSDKVPVSNYRVRYSLLDKGPPAALYPNEGAKAGTPREILVPTGADGLAVAKIAELQPDFGTSQVAIEVQRPDTTQPSGFTVVARSQTKIDWQAPQVKVTIAAPTITQVNQSFPVTYSVASTGTLETRAMVLKSAVPPGLELVSSEPKATADRGELLWSLPSLPGGTQHTVQAVYKPTRTGEFTATASVRTDDNLNASNSAASVQVTEAKLQIALTGPAAGFVGENVPFVISVQNTGSGAATNVKVKAAVRLGLRSGRGKPGAFETTIDKLEAGKTQTISLPLSPRQPGRSAVKASVKADGNQSADAPAIGIDIKKPELTVEIKGPARAFLNQEITWTLSIVNPSDVTSGNVNVRAILPPEFTFKRASNDGKLVDNAVVWNLGTTVGKQWMDLQLTAVASKLGTTELTASAAGQPLSKRDGDFKPVAMAKGLVSEETKAAVEILGIAALQLGVTDSADPLQIGQSVTYTIKVKNAGTLQDNQVEITANLPPQLKPVRVSGPSAGKIVGQNVVFVGVEAIKPNDTSTFTIEAQAISEGDGRFHDEVMSMRRQPLSTDESTRVLPAIKR